MMADPRLPYSPHLQGHSPRQAIQYQQHHPYSNPYAYPSSEQLSVPSSSNYASEYSKMHQRQKTPSFQLLHSRFARDSVATASSKEANSYLDLNRDSVDSKADINYQFYDEESIYSTEPAIEPSSPALRDSWESGTTARRHLFNDEGDLVDPSSSRDPQPTTSLNTPNTPTFIISTWPEQTQAADSRISTMAAGKTPIIRPVASNFSMPHRPQYDHYDEIGSEGHKRMVLERNATRRSSPGTSARLSPQPQRPGIPYNQYQDGHSQYSPMNNAIYPSPPTSSQSSQFTSSPFTTSIPSTPDPSQSTTTLARSVTLSGRPPSIRSGSPVSLYSTYSYYDLGSATPSPTSPSGFPGSSSMSKGVHYADGVKPPAPRGTSRNATPVNGTSPSTSMQNLNISDEDDEALRFLQLGIKHHEVNELSLSASYFEKSATVNGGCGVGMLMWGLTLRHGWGCPKNEKMGFKWLRKAAESAVEDLESARKSGDGQWNVGGKAVQSELILAIYEVGQCFFHGWGVPKDQKMGVSYYQVAARLGDADAQNDLGFCLANGKGCKKDRKEAAKWYRAAVAQGHSDVGLAWIYKEKLQ